MSWYRNITTSVFGNRLGLQALTTNTAGVTKTFEVLVGPEAVRSYYSTAETTGTNLPPHGVSVLTTSTGGTTSSLYTLDPPIPGVRKTLVFVSTNTATNMIGVIASTGATVTISSSQGSTMCILQSTGGVACAIELVAQTTAAWVALGSLSSATIRATTASC